MKDFVDQRRQFLINALTAGVYAVGSMGILQPVYAMGKVPKELVPGKSIYDMRGTVLINGKAANLESNIGPNDIVETGSSSHIIFAVGKDAFILRSNSKLKMKGSNTIIKNINLLGGKLLSVFGRRPVNQKIGIRTVVATIGIRGTGIYVESEPQSTYVCTCYGVVDIVAANDNKSQERIVSRHHDAPRLIFAGEMEGKKIQAAPVINHTDDELALIETLVGRTVPFLSAGSYSAPRKSSY